MTTSRIHTPVVKEHLCGWIHREKSLEWHCHNLLDLIIHERNSGEPLPRQLILPSNLLNCLVPIFKSSYFIGSESSLSMNETQISCPHCTQLLAHIAQLAGQQAICPACQKAFTMPQAVVRPDGAKPLPARYANMRRERSPKMRWVILYLVVIIGGTLFCAFGELALQFLLR